MTPPEEKKPVYLSLVNDSTIVASSSKDYVAEALTKKAGKRAEVKKELAGLLEKADANQSISVVVLASAVSEVDALQDNEKAKALAAKVISLTGGVTISDDIKADFVIATKDAAGAAEVNKTITGGLGLVAFFASQDPNLAPLADVVGGIRVTTAGTNVQIKAHVSKDVIDKAINKAGQ
jgi:hypothetical protein